MEHTSGVRAQTLVCHELRSGVRRLDAVTSMAAATVGLKARAGTALIVILDDATQRHLCAELGGGRDDAYGDGAIEIFRSQSIFATSF